MLFKTFFEVQHQHSGRNMHLTYDFIDSADETRIGGF